MKTAILETLCINISHHSVEEEEIFFKEDGFRVNVNTAVEFSAH